MRMYICVYFCVYIYLFQALSVSIMSAALNVKLRIHCMFVVASRSKIQVAGEFLKSKIRAQILIYIYIYRFFLLMYELMVQIWLNDHTSWLQKQHSLQPLQWRAYKKLTLAHGVMHLFKSIQDLIRPMKGASIPPEPK